MFYKAIAFDMDGILFNTEEIYTGVIRRALQVSEITLDEADCKSLVGIELSDWLKCNVPSYLVNSIKNDVNELMLEAIDNREIQVKWGVVEFLEALKKSSIHIALATSTHKNKAMMLLDRFNLRLYFDVMVFGDEVSTKKPCPEMYKRIIKHYGYKSEEVLAIEDSEVGILSASNAGLDVAYVRDILDINENIAIRCTWLGENMKVLADDLINQSYSRFTNQIDRRKKRR